MFYFAYGSNLNKAQMARRCPNATPLCPLILPDARLVFRGVADCIEQPGSTCAGAVWVITPECERTLDIYEGVRGGMYRKEFIDIEPFEGEDRMLIYRMNSKGIFPPSKSYYESIRVGYRDFQLSTRSLREALAASWDDKHPSHVERKRHRRNGRPALALRRDVGRV
jgi:Gamma-glutamyl cyclotransferase, AIG2-like